MEFQGEFDRGHDGISKKFEDEIRGDLQRNLNEREIQGN